MTSPVSSLGRLGLQVLHELPQPGLDLMDEWIGGLYDVMNQAEMDAPWQPRYNTVHTAKHLEYDWKDARDWMAEIGYDPGHWVHKLLLTDLVAEYGLTEGNSTLNLIYLFGFSNRGSGGLPLAGTDERFHIVGGNDQVPNLMANQLPSGSVQLEHKLKRIKKENSGSFKLWFQGIKQAVTCDVLVMAMPLKYIYTSMKPQWQKNTLIKLLN